MALVARADAAAFELIYDRHCDAAFALAYRMCGKSSFAEEIVQEAFISLWRSAAGYQRARGSVRNWVLRIVHNRAVDALRRSVVRDVMLHPEQDITERIAGAEHTEEEFERREQADELRFALETLPPEQRRVIELAYFSGFTHTEIAEVLQMPVGTVKGRMRLGLSKLRIALATSEQQLAQGSETERSGDERSAAAPEAGKRGSDEKASRQ
ncbi:MAG TPA: sigma-70 family RNA polymerase sigma factor [Solirubrobacteraceae bacterium]|jgi:RNA polymerase sigma-70 factor (ECF subfamily)